MAFQDFDFISERRKQERKQKLKKRITIAIVVTLLVVAVAVAAVVVTLNQQKHTEEKPKNKPQSDKKQNQQEPAKSSKLVKSICDDTDFKDTCESSLKKTLSANPSAQPKDLLKSAISSVNDELEKAMNEASKIKFDTPEKKAAFDVCKEVIEDANDELNSSTNALAEKELTKLSAVTPELDNWLSAVMTYQQTCIDAIPEGEQRDAVQKAFKTSKELTSNSLAMVSQASSILSNVPKSSSQRRLFSLDSDKLPTWMNNEDRRILKADAPKQTPNVTVAKDGSGNFTKINDALAALPANYKGR